MGVMRSDNNDMYWWLFGGSGTILFPWERVFSSWPNINDTLVISSKPSVMRTDIALVDLTTNSTSGLARSQDSVHIAENGEFNIALRNVEYVTAAADKVVDFFQIDHFGFTTDGSIRTLEANVGNHLVSFETAERDSFIFLGDGIDQVVLGDDPDVFIAGDPNVNYPTYWAVKRDFDNSVIAYALSTGNKVELRGGDAASKATLPGENYGEIEILTHSNFRGGPDTDLYLGKGGIQDPYERSGFENIDLNTSNLDSPIDTFLHASFGSINFSSRNVFVGAAVIEEWNNYDETAERQSEAYRFSTTSTAAVDHNHDLMVAAQATSLDGHLRLYVRDEDSRTYNRFNEVFLGSNDNDVNVNSGATTSRNGTSEKIYHTAMYGFGGNDSLTAGDGNDYLFGGESTYTSFVEGPIGNIVTGGDGADYFGVGNIAEGATGDEIFSAYNSSRLAGTAPEDVAGSPTDVGQLYRTGAEETADLATRVATDRIQDWTWDVDSLRVLANGTAIIEGLGTTNGSIGGGYGNDLIGSDNERIDVSGAKVVNEGKIVLRGAGGNDTIIGSDGDDWFYGNSGDNLIVAGAAVSGTDGSSDGNDRIHYDTYAGRTFAAGFDAGDKVYLNKKVLDAITGNFSRITEVADNLTSSATSMSGNSLSGPAAYTAAVAYNPQINFLHDVFYGPNGALPSNQQHENGPGFVDGSDSYADNSTALIGAGMFAAGTALVATGILAAAGFPLIAAGTALGAGGLAGGFFELDDPASARDLHWFCI